MKPITILSFLLISFLNFGQELNVNKQLSLELGFKTFASSRSSDEINGDSGPGHGYYKYQLDKANITGYQGHIQLSYSQDRFLFPLGIGYIRMNEEMHGSERGGYNLTTTPSYYASSFSFERYSEYGTLFTGFGVSFFSSQEKMFFGPIARLNYTYLFGHVITKNESTYTQYDATDYVSQGNQDKHSIRPSFGLLFRYNTRQGFQFNIEAGYKRLNNNAASYNEINAIRGAAYAQFSIGLDLSKLSAK